MQCTACGQDMGQLPVVDASYYVTCPHCRAPTVVPAGRMEEPDRRDPAQAPRRSDRHRQLVSEDPHRPADLVIDGKARGGHWPEAERYVATARFPGRLPHLLVYRQTGFAGRASTAVRQPMDDDALDRRLCARSDGAGMPRRFFAHERLRDAALAAPSLLFLEVLPEPGAHTALTVSARDPDDCLALAQAAVDVVDRLLAAGVTFPDAMAALLGVGSDEVISPATLERLVDRTAEVTSWLQGHVARVGDAVEARLTLDELGAPLAGTLRISWSGDASVTAAALEAALPEDKGEALTLWAETRSIASRVRARFEEQLGDAALDQALHVDGDMRRAHEVMAVRAPSLALAARGGRIVVDGARLRATIPPAGRGFDEVHAVATDLLTLWRSLAIHRAGHPLATQELAPPR